MYLLPKTTIGNLDKKERSFLGKVVETKNIILLDGIKFVLARKKVGWELRT
jgi:hypothetical protein